MAQAPLNYHCVGRYQTRSGVVVDDLSVSYQLFGPPLTENRPLVVVVHALTGNSNVADPNTGWWRQLIGSGRCIDTRRFTVLAFNIPGNGYDGRFFDNYLDWTARDMAIVFNQVLAELRLGRIHAIIGGSLGGGIAWEMAALQPKWFRYIIPVATDWKSTDWVIGHNYIQERLLLAPGESMAEARMMAMLFYRNPKALRRKFSRTRTADGSMFNAASWLRHHGRRIEERFDRRAYLLMNQLLSTIDITAGRVDFHSAVEAIDGTIIQVAIDSDVLFSRDEIWETKQLLDESGVNNRFYEIASDEGHDAFLIEFEQLTRFLEPYFTAEVKRMATRRPKRACSSSGSR